MSLNHSKLLYYGRTIISVTELSSNRDITLKSVFDKISCIFLEKNILHKKGTQINAYIIANNHRHYAHFVNNFLSTNSVKFLRDMTKCLI